MTHARQKAMAAFTVMALATASTAGAQGARPSVTPAATTPMANSITSTTPNTGTQTDPSGTTLPNITPAPPNRG